MTRQIVQYKLVVLIEVLGKREYFKPTQFVQTMYSIFRLSISHKAKEQISKHI